MPEGPPPTGEMPPWPFPVDVEEYEMADESGRWMWLGPRPPPVTTGLSQQSVQRLDERTGWIEQELMGMKKAFGSRKKKSHGIWSSTDWRVLATTLWSRRSSTWWPTPEQGSWRTSSRQSGFGAATPEQGPW